jgi:hypothetical protein
MQNMELWWMLGGLSSSATTVAGTNTVISGTVGFSTEIGYGYQVKSTKAGNLWLEAPMTFTWQGSGIINGSTVVGGNRNFWFFTPGVRLKTPTFGRVSFYGSVGGGIGTVIDDTSVVSETQGTSTQGVSLKVHAWGISREESTCGSAGC